MVNISGIFPANWVIIYHRSHLLRVNVPKRPWGILNQKMHHGLNSSDESFSFETEHFNHWFVDQVYGIQRLKNDHPTGSLNTMEEIRRSQPGM